MIAVCDNLCFRERERVLDAIRTGMHTIVYSSIMMLLIEIFWLRLETKLQLFKKRKSVS